MNIKAYSIWVTHERTNPDLCNIQPPFYILGAHLHVTEAFNSDGTDNISVGYDADTDSVFTNTTCNTTGVKSPTMGSDNGYNGTARNYEVYYTASGSEPSTGRALVILEVLHPLLDEPA